VSFVPTLGHTPGHVSVRISSEGEEALITGDFVHHPCQMAHPEWAATVDYDQTAFREEFGRSRGEPTGGGATPLMGQGEARAVGFARDTLAWNGSGETASAAPVALDARLHDLWTTPHGVLIAAQRWGARAGTASDGGQAFTTLSVTVPGRLEATAWIDAQGRVDRIASVMPHPVLGDTPVLTRFSDYRPVAGSALQFPMRIRQTQGNFDVLDLQVAEVQVNPAVTIEAPPQVRAFRETVAVQVVAPGVWFLGGGSHNSVAIETASQIVLVESPLYDGRAQAVLQAANMLVPGKTVQTVVNSHHHFDHAGGLRAAAADGAVLVTSAMAAPYFERVFANPNRVQPDRLAASGRTPKFIGVAGRQVLADGPRRIEVHELQGSVHAQGFLAVYLPAEKLLIEADAYTPGPPNSPPPPVVNDNQRNLVDNIERLGLQVDRILPLHGRVVPMKELLAQIGR
jgi:glyoxylase-like metal-dependent hydrolase (beta-lactamase superfamily II)